MKKEKVIYQCACGHYMVIDRLDPCPNCNRLSKKMSRLNIEAAILAFLGLILDLALLTFIIPSFGVGFVYIAITAALASLTYLLWTVVQYQSQKYLISLFGLAISLSLAFLLIILIILR